MKTEHEIVELAKKLIQQPSLTPTDAGCQKIFAEILQPLGFHCETLQFGEVTNLWAIHNNILNAVEFSSRRQTGNTRSVHEVREEGDPCRQHPRKFEGEEYKKPLFVFAGHTDVVPTGPLEKWHTPPFEPTIKEGYLYGRGASDMKGSLAAMLIAVKKFLNKNNNFNGSIGFLITSDEEGPSIDGTQKVMEVLTARHIKIDACLVGEPSCMKNFGDTIKIGRRGSLHAHIEFLGKQGHAAYPERAQNAIHNSLKPLQKLVDEKWDEGNEHFPPTTMQIVNIKGGTGAGNVIPGENNVHINWRYNTEYSAESLQNKITTLLNACNVPYNIRFEVSGEPFLTHDGSLRQAVVKAIEEITHITPTLSTIGGTSDGRFIAPTGAQVIEFGPLNDTIHQLNECIKIDDLVQLAKVYERILERFFG